MKISYNNFGGMLRRVRLAIATCLLIASSVTNVQGQQPINLTSIIHDLQQLHQDQKELTLAFWMPEAFWMASMSQDPSITKEQIDQLLDTLRPYTIIGVLSGTRGNLGAVTFKSKEAIRANVEIKDVRGLSHVPLNESDVDQDTKLLLRMLQPAMEQMIGPMGENMHYFAFRSKSKDGRIIADPTGEGSFYIMAEEQEFQYRLPLGSFLPRKYDPKTAESFPGDYNYNPYTGNELVTRSSSTLIQPQR